MSQFKPLGKRKRRRVKHPGRCYIEKNGYGPNWYAQRERARKRDNDTCQQCGHVGGCHVHHRRKIAWFYDSRTQTMDYESANHLDNLVCLCPVCHPVKDRGHSASSGFVNLSY